MANQTGSNPKIFDANTGTIVGHFTLRLLQWVDDNADVADNGNLVFTMNGVTFEATIQRAAAPDGAAVLWQIGPFNPSMPCHDLSIATISGHLHIWT